MQGGTSSSSRAKGRWPWSIRPRQRGVSSSRPPKCSMSHRLRRPRTTTRSSPHWVPMTCGRRPPFRCCSTASTWCWARRTWARCIYIAGTEGFIGQAMQVAMNHGVDSCLDPYRASRLGGTPRAVRALQGHHRQRDDQPLHLHAIAACRFWCAITIRAASAPSRACASMLRNRARHRKPEELFP